MCQRLFLVVAVAVLFSGLPAFADRLADDRPFVLRLETPAPVEDSWLIKAPQHFEINLAQNETPGPKKTLAFELGSSVAVGQGICRYYYGGMKLQKRDSSLAGQGKFLYDGAGFRAEPIGFLCSIGEVTLLLTMVSDSALTSGTPESLFLGARSQLFFDTEGRIERSRLFLIAEYLMTLSLQDREVMGYQGRLAIRRKTVSGKYLDLEIRSFDYPSTSGLTDAIVAGGMISF